MLHSWVYVCPCVLAHACACSHLVKTGSLIKCCVFCWTCLKASSQILPQSDQPALPGESLSNQIISSFLREKKDNKIKKEICIICWKHFSSPYRSIFTSVLHFTPVLKRCLPPLCLARLFHWCKVNYVSVSFPFCGCCLTRATKLNTRSGCPLYNLASNSKDFPESLAKLLGIIFLYFGTPLTCCRYLFSLFFFFFFLQMTLSLSMCITADSLFRLVLSPVYQHETVWSL